MKTSKFSMFAAAVLAAAGFMRAEAVGNGHVYEFSPVTEVNTVTTSFGAAQEVQFKMRLATPNPEAPLAKDRHTWEIYYKANPGATVTEQTLAWMTTPLQLGVMVSGQIRPCALSFPALTDNRRFHTEFTCTYVTKYGDLALPLRLAMNDDGYILLNDNIWGIRDAEEFAATGNIVEPSMVRYEGDAVPPVDLTRNGSIDLAWDFAGTGDASKAYYIRTIGFDDQGVTDEKGTWWRTVNEGRTTYKPDVPAIRVDNLPENPVDLYLYVWSEDDEKVTMKFTDNDKLLAAANVSKMSFADRTGTVRDFWVKRIKLDGLTAEYPFDMRGVARSDAGTTLVLRAAPGYAFQKTVSPNVLLEDFLTVQVRCSDPLPPTVTAKVNGLVSDTVTVRARGDVATRVATLTVELSDPYEAGDFKVKVEPKLATDGEPTGESALGYFGLSEKSAELSYLDKTVEVEFLKGETTKTLYVYAWGADAKTYGANKSVVFMPEIEDPAAAAVFVGGCEKAMLLVKTIKPTVVEPVADQLISVNCSVPYGLTIKVSDTYNDMNSEDGYEVYVKRDISRDLEFTKLEGRYRPDAEGVLYSVPDPSDPDAAPQLPKVTWENTDTEKAALYVKSPRSGEKSLERQVALFVKPARQIGITATDGREGNQYVEGEDVNVRIDLLNAKNDTGDTIYAFLVPQGEATNAVSATWTSGHGKFGRPIPKDGNTVQGLFTLLDGTRATKQGEMYDFKIELRTASSYDEGELVPGFESRTLTLYSRNVEPNVKWVEMTNNVIRVKTSGERFDTVVARNVQVGFSVKVNEPGTYDKTTDVEGKKFGVRWVVREKGKTAKSTEVWGDPDKQAFFYQFTKEGIATVEVYLKDKDMDDWMEDPFVFEVEVVSNPLITVEATTGVTSFSEIDSLDAGGEAALNVKVSLNPIDTEPLRVELTIVPPSAAASDNPGTFVLQESASCTKTAENVYVVLLDGVTEMPVNVKTLDGTPLSRSTGFTIKSRVLNDGIEYPDVPGETPASYYRGVDANFKVTNEKPQVDLADLYPQPETTNRCAIGTADAITWNFTDVVPDFTKGITVTIKGGGGFTTNVTSSADAVGSFAPTFTESGLQTVQMTIKDKDNGSVSFIWYYEVAVSKKLVLNPHGPTAGKGAANSKRYRTAGGLGEGHVYGGVPSAVSAFESTYNCQMAKSWTVWGFGYKVGAPYDDGTLNGGRDFGLTPAGGAADAGLPRESYYRYPADGIGLTAYVDTYGRPADSFLYTWLRVTRGEESAGFTDEILNEAVSPEYAAIASDSGTPVGLPTELLDDNTYDDTILEAIFSREWLASDNMGDINFDGIPDIYVDKYGFGVVDPQTGKLMGDDLASQRGNNEDEDFLPGNATAYLGSLIPGLRESWQQKFTAVLEIRGYGEALNDAPVQLGINGIKPDLVYGNPDPTAADYCPSSTLSKVEYMAWCEYAAANLPAGAVSNAAFFKMWSPERPTDPSKVDTDEDGFDDGFEYYFWYLAHVGYIDASGRHRRLAGRRYDPRNPGEGVLITPEEIEAIMDPLVAYTGEDAETRDTDNDGLPDLLEFELGTNPFDFDTDGDGLADGWELMIAGLDPLLAGSSADAKVDGERNYDGDAMAISSFQLEKAMKPVPYTSDHAKRVTFAVLDPNGDTDGVQWYAALTEPVTATQETSVAAWSFKAEGRTYVVYGVEPKKYDDPMSTNKILAVTYPKGFRDADGVDHGAFLSGDVTEYDEPALDEEGNPVPSDVQATDAEGNLLFESDGTTPIYVPLTNHIAVAERGYPVRVEAGVAISDVKEGVQPIVLTIGEEIDARTINAAWIYGRGAATNLVGDVAKTAAEYGCLALGRHQAPAQGAVVCAAVSDERDVAFLHYLCYQEFGFDPRTAWKAQDPLATRWSKSIDGQAVEGITTLKAGGFTGAPARTRDYTTYDEFLVCSFFENNGCEMSGVTFVIDDEAPAMARYWGAFTTNPQGKDEPGLISAEHYYGRNSDNGADTDLDGVPDGWELYVMSGPKNADGTYVFAPPYAGFAGALSGADYPLPQSYFSPFLSFAQKTETSNQVYLGGQINDDLMNEYQEFEGTDTMAYYADLSDTVVHTGEWKWFNKFFPTDPWSKDTDGDGIDDKSEGAVFVYGTPADDGKLWSIPGGGLNPCSVDTDQDGLPDPWERQFKPADYSGQYTEANAKKTADGTAIIDFAKDETGAPIGNALQGLTDGMDGTVADAFSYPADKIVLANGFRQVVNRDYDRDGLENWQEYMTGTMRCWRYDDPYSPWVSIPTDWYFSKNAAGELSWNPRYDKFGLEQDDFNGFWYMTLVDDKSPYYNPHLITDQNQGAQYFSPVTNGWDVAYDSWQLNGSTRYYWFYNRVGGKMIKDYWVGPGLPPGPLAVCLSEGMRMEPTKYCSCSPIDPDSDHDGMDDYYELFHGMNPLLGESGVPLSSQGPCDLVYDAWYIDGAGALEAWGKDATMNYWQQNLDKLPRMPRGNGYDFVVFPWLNGAAGADPDGDDIRNDEESIMARVAPSVAWHHTDPTPLWMTDSSYTNSLVRQYFRIPAGLGDVKLDLPFFVHDETKFFFRDFDGFVDKSLTTKGMVIDPYAIETFGVDQWSVAGEGLMNWMYSFEENEGFDTDHDGLSDHEELESKFRAGTDPQDADSPRRRQAMYFQGKDRPSALQTLPFIEELHPVGATSYPQDMSFLQYTVECWAMPESLDDATLVERAVYTGESNPGDEEFMRKNFQLGIRDGKWYTKFDPNGTLADNAVEVLSALPATAGAWTHLAATYDGTFLTLYVNGKAEKPARSGLQPSNGSSAVALLPDQSYWFDREYPLQAIVVGASFKTNGDGMPDGGALDVTQGWGWDRYTGFYKGYVDEIRVWDGVRTKDEIVKSMNVRFTAEDAKQNREQFYGKWAQGLSRYAKDGTGKDADVLAELRFHWTFDSVYGAENEKAVAKVPHGFGPEGLKAPVSRPDDYGVAWYGQVLFGGDGKPGYAGAVYDDPLWVTWIPNTVTHLPRFDGTTLDSMYWSDDFRGDVAGQYALKKTTEPVSRWTQMVRNGVSASSQYWSTDARHQLVNGLTTGTGFAHLYEFAGRNRNQTGDDLIPLGGAFVKYVPGTPGLWDKQGASSVWELTGGDADSDGLPDWWEIYAEQNYREGVDPTKPISWSEPLINYNGIMTTPGEAYMRDLARGSYLGEDGKVHIGPTEYLQTADADHTGMPDWWTEMYGIKGESGLDDHDNDGLPNYVEYLLSEVFAFKGLRFDPTIAKSVDPETPDYFIPVGSLYVGEIFTDHDLVDDAWEDLYDDSYASRLAWDALADNDNDGWCNRSENRYAKAVMPIVADQKTHYTAADGLVADYPIPTLAVKLRYEGNRQKVVEAAPIVIQVTRDGKYAKEPDATYLVGAAETSKGDTGTSSADKGSTTTASTEVSKTRTLGKWSNRHAIGTLTPGNIKQNSLALEFCYDPSSVMYSWMVFSGTRWASDDGSSSGGSGVWIDKRGTRLEYDADKRKYGDENIQLIGADTSYAALADLELRADEKSSLATWIHTKSGLTIGTVNLVTGEFDLDLGVFKGQYVENGTNGTDYVSLEDQTFRIAYTANPSVGLPRMLYLGAADTGFVKEGENTIVAWADLDGDGAWTVGEPYGMVRGVDVSWKGTSAEIELTDATAVMPRVDLAGDESDNNVTRDELLAKVLEKSINRSFDEQWIANNTFKDATTVVGDTFRGQRIRVVRWLVNGVPVYRAGTSARVVLDKKIETDVRSCLTEADILAGDESVFDLDWANLRSEVTSRSGVRAACGEVREVSYLVVVGDGSVAWDSKDATNSVAALKTVITRKYGESHVKPTPVAPGKTGGEIVQTANPTFKWTMNCPDEEAYTAFRIRVSGASGTVYDSGLHLAPPKVDGAYVWSAPLFAGDKTLAGKVFENKADYTWQVSMYNAKFTEDAYSEAGQFYLDVQTNGYHYGTASVAVRYFGPESTWAGGAKNGASVIRVCAYTSPDFTGTPVAAGYVADPANADYGVAVTGKTVTANCQVIGIPRGTYYFQAYVDSNNNGVCDPWETSGYLCSREGETADYLDPKAMTFADELGEGDLAVIYLEDADTDGDGLPDAWEYAEYGSLEEKGVELLSETGVGEFMVNTDLSGALEVQENANTPSAGLAGRLGGRLLSNAGMLALAAGAPTRGYDTFGAAIGGSVATELVEGGVKIASLDLTAGKVTIRVEAETDVKESAVLGKLLDVDGSLRVICDVKWTATLAETPKTIKTQEITVGVTAAEIDLGDAVPESASGFFSVEIRKK